MNIHKKLSMAIAGVVFIALEAFGAVRVEAVTVGGDPRVNPANFRITEEEVFQRIKVPILKLLAAQMYQQLLCKAKVFEGTLCGLASMDNLHDRIRVALTPSSTDRAWLPLPPFLYFLYYLLRPLRLVQKYKLGPAKIGRLLQTLV